MSTYEINFEKTLTKIEDSIRLGDFNEALLLMKDLPESYKYNWRILFDLGNIYLLNKNYFVAKTLYGSCLQQGIKNSSLYYNFAIANDCLGNNDVAEVYYNQAVDSAVDDRRSSYLSAPT